MRTLDYVVAAGFALLLVTASPVRAQDQPAAPSPGVADQTGPADAGSAPIKGRLLDITPETLALLVDGQRVEIPMHTVKVVSVGGDSVKDGAAIGAVVMGTLCALTVCRFSENPGQFVTVLVFEAGLGALIGAGIDAMHSSPTIVYRKQAAGTPALRPAVTFRWKF
jgi:hypothetical protein